MINFTSEQKETIKNFLRDHSNTMRALRIRYYILNDINFTKYLNNIINIKETNIHQEKIHLIIKFGLNKKYDITEDTMIDIVDKLYAPGFNYFTREELIIALDSNIDIRPIINSSLKSHHIELLVSLLKLNANIDGMLELINEGADKRVLKQKAKEIKLKMIEDSLK